MLREEVKNLQFHLKEMVDETNKVRLDHNKLKDELHAGEEQNLELNGKLLLLMEQLEDSRRMK